ncbi:MAG: hypothetical protein RLY31_1138 [Bacteroidota bacterium]
MLRRSLQAQAGKRSQQILVVETYPGTDLAELNSAWQRLEPALVLDAESAFRPPAEISAMAAPDVTDDRIFGVMTGLRLEQYLDAANVSDFRQRIRAAHGLVILHGTGASLVAEDWDLLVYADLTRWEIQQRMRRGQTGNLGVDNAGAEISRLYKQAYFVDWRIADRRKQALMDRWDFMLDTNRPTHPVMVSAHALSTALHHLTQRPFRLVPFFDPGPWGGQWMKSVCDLDPAAPNYAWCFDCVPEENSLLLDFGPAVLEIPAVNLVFREPERLLGPAVYQRFGAEFPIRFDFLDTMDGGNLSWQVHPSNEYIRAHFGMSYTQDESYYLLDAKPDGVVYLGLQEGVDCKAMMAELREARDGQADFDADRYAARWPARKHDHFLIPAGTVHCSGRNTMVLEVSATPYIFTFKLWDWGRLGLDGLPRPINLEHGEANIRWERTAEWVRLELVNHITPLGAGTGWREERTGLHETEFIETRRHWFTGTVRHDTGGGVNVLNLVEGAAVVVESPTDAFPPFVVHYAETFVVPAAVGPYTIRPFGEGARTECATIKAFVRP